MPVLPLSGDRSHSSDIDMTENFLRQFLLAAMTELLTTKGKYTELEQIRKIKDHVAERHTR